MIVSDIFEQSVILRPIAAGFVWLKVGATRCNTRHRCFLGRPLPGCISFCIVALFPEVPGPGPGVMERPGGIGGGSRGLVLQDHYWILPNNSKNYKYMPASTWEGPSLLLRTHTPREHWRFLAPG